MSTKFVATGTQIVTSMALGVGGKRGHVRAAWYADAGVTGATVTLQGSMDNITFGLLINSTNGLKGSGTWCHPGQPGYRYFDLAVAGYAGTGNVTAEIDTFCGVSAGSAHGGARMW
jgi:hypothetical protein